MRDAASESDDRTREGTGVYPRLAMVLDEYEATFGMTAGDLADQVELLVDEAEAPAQALALVSAYRAEVDDNHRAWGGRNDMDAAEELLVAGLRRLAGEMPVSIDRRDSRAQTPRPSC